MNDFFKQDRPSARRLFGVSIAALFMFHSAAMGNIANIAPTTSRFSRASATCLKSVKPTPDQADRASRQAEFTVRGLHADLAESGFLQNPFLPPPAPTTPFTSQKITRELRPQSGGTAVFLSALLTLGALGAARSARNVRFADVPCWYHAGAPTQIAHAIVWDCKFPNLVLHWITQCERCTVQARGCAGALLLDCCVCADSQHCVTSMSPRGPPLPSYDARK